MYKTPAICEILRMEAWCGVEVRHLATLEAIDRERSFRGAAERLGYVQSAVSQQLSRLEKLVGVRLVERTRGHAHVELTPAGELLLAHANRVLAQLRAAKRDLDAATSGTGGPFRVGAFESVAVRVIPRVLSLLAATHPELRLRAVDATTDLEMFEQVLEGQLDAAFAELPLLDGPFEGRRLISERAVLLVERESPLALAEGAPTLEQLAGLPLAIQHGWRMASLIERHFESAGLRPDVRYSPTSHAATQALVAAGLSAAIVPRLAVHEPHPDIQAIELDCLPRRTIALYWHAEHARHPGLDAFIDAVEAICGRMADRPAVGAPPSPAIALAGI